MDFPKASKVIRVQKLSKGDSRRKKWGAIAEDEHQQTDGAIDTKARRVRSERTTSLRKLTQWMWTRAYDICRGESEDLQPTARPPNPAEPNLRDASAQLQYTLSEWWTIEKNVANEGSIAHSYARI
ncbi:hypothetical protein EDC04DRAFT_2607902 [Pisolithus marmoratus]|nr:hypothetical protein EDC04DRAFT_2607902 [Pisolithus marmoratus]